MRVPLSLIYEVKVQPIVEDHVLEFMDLYEAGHRFKPITLKRDGDRYRLIDGRHRSEASRRLGYTDIEAVLTL